jgi:hypothetical protein
MADMVVFTIAAWVPPDQQDAVIAAVQVVDGVTAAFRLAPESTVPEILRMGVATVADGAEQADVVDRLRLVPGVESADIPPPRGLP